jgi:hypothetical protein
MTDSNKPLANDQESLSGELISQFQGVDQEIEKIKRDLQEQYEAKKSIEETAKSYAILSSQVLAGIVGGVLGGAIGVIGFEIPGAGGLVVVSGPLGVAAGAASLIFLFRLRQSLLKQEINSEKLKYKLQEFRQVTEATRREIESLEAFLLEHKESITSIESNQAMARIWSYREEAIQQLWEMYRRLVEKQFADFTQMPALNQPMEQNKLLVSSDETRKED